MLLLMRGVQRRCCRPCGHHGLLEGGGDRSHRSDLPGGLLLLPCDSSSSSSSSSAASSPKGLEHLLDRGGHDDQANRTSAAGVAGSAAAGAGAGAVPTSASASAGRASDKGVLSASARDERDLKRGQSNEAYQDKNAGLTLQERLANLEFSDDEDDDDDDPLGLKNKNG
mmetsp:Transcript_18427/g.39408  ORF Transcript_18427/g.39408 Transcript_18427/m.39408 type:complete len:169 (-) Transcript_18427:116-622(-)